MSPYLVNLKSNTMKKITLQMYNIHALFANISLTKVIHLKIFHIKRYTYHIITIRKQSIYSKNRVGGKRSSFLPTFVF